MSQAKKRQSRGSLTKVLGLFLPHERLRKSRLKHGGGPTHRDTFSLRLVVSPYSGLLRSTGGGKKGAKRRRGFRWS